MKWHYWFLITCILALCMLYSQDFFFFVLFLSWGILNVVNFCTHKFIKHVFFSTIDVQRKGQKNQQIPITIRLKHRSLLPISKAMLYIEAKNQLTNETLTEVLPVSIGRNNTRTITGSVEIDSCGQWNIRLLKIVIGGILPWGKKECALQDSASFISWPIIFPIQINSSVENLDETIPILHQQSSLKQTTERLGLRPYRMGDSIKQIHWKLSAKNDELVVQEHIEQPQSVLAFYIEKPKDVEQYDAMLSMLFSLLTACMQQSKLAYISIDGTRYECTSSQQLEKIADQILQGKTVTMPEIASSCIAIVTDETVIDRVIALALRCKQTEAECHTPYDFTKDTMSQNFASVIL